MKPLKGLKKLRLRWISGRDDPQTEHVKKAFQQDVHTDEVYRRLRTSEAQDLVALSVLPSPDGQNETHPETVPRMTGHSVADTSGAPKDTQGIQTSSKHDISPINNEEPTRIEPSPRFDGSAHDIKKPQASTLPSPFNGLPLGYNHLKKRDSPKTIREFSPEGNMPTLLDLTGESQASQNGPEEQEGPDHSSFIPVEQDPLGPFYDDFYTSDQFFDNPDRSETIFELEGHREPILSRQHHPERSANLQYQSESLREEQTYLQSIPDRLFDELPSSGGPQHSETLLDRSHPVNHPESAPHRLDHQMLIANPPDHKLPILEEQEDPTGDADQQDNQNRSFDIQVHSEPPAITPNEEPQDTGPPGQDQDRFVSDKQSRPESLGSKENNLAKDHRRRLRWEAKLHNLLSRILQTRARAYEHRSQLRQLRSEISNADEAFMKLVRDKRFQGSQDDVALRESFEKLQDARDKYGPLEEIYNTLEEQVNREEYEAKELQDKILKSELSAPDIYIDSRSSGVRGNGSEVSEIVRELYHPLYERYLSRLGDADICREAIVDLMNEHDYLLHAQETRRRVGLELSPDNQVTLGNFPAAEAKLLDELRRIDEDVELLKLECIREGLIEETEGHTEPEPVFEGDGDGQDEEIHLPHPVIGSFEQEQTEYDKYSLLLEKPEEKEDENKSRVLLTNFKQGDAGDRITCWLLHKLRLSSLEVDLLARYTDGLDHSAGTEKWQEEVLEFWFSDDANLPPSAYEVEPTLTAYLHSPMTDLDKRSHEPFGDSYLIQLVIRSSALSRKLDIRMRLKLTQMKGRSAVSI